MYDSNKYIITQIHNTEISINRIAVLRAAVEIFALHINNFSSFVVLADPLCQAHLVVDNPCCSAHCSKSALVLIIFPLKSKEPTNKEQGVRT